MSPADPSRYNALVPSPRNQTVGMIVLVLILVIAMLARYSRVLHWGAR